MYLENIFVGSEDIRKQLPQESLLFDGVNAAFSAAMRELHAVGNVAAATTPPRVLAAFEVITVSPLSATPQKSIEFTPPHHNPA